MTLESIKIEHFKRIKSIELPISDLNILVGSNGSGKSSVLQALHLASCLMRQADRIRSGSTSMVRVGDLDYLPSDEYWRLGHAADWGNKSSSPSSHVRFDFKNNESLALPGMPITATLEMRSARNAGISVKGELPEQVRAQFRGENIYFSGFIPGISGIPNVEQKNAKRVVMKACSFGDSNVYLRNALDLLTDNELKQVEKWLLPLLGEIQLKISFNADKDLSLHAEAIIDEHAMPLELLGTGYLQLIQTFCYILLFKPKILLIDEPDIHLHPSVQESLTGVLAGIASERGIKVIISTHSPFIVRGAPAGTNVVWLESGEKHSENRDAIELALGWGAFGKKILLVSEDKNNEHLKKLLSQWPQLERLVSVIPGRGYKHLLTKEEAQELKESLGNKFKILVHRDRDSLSDAEVSTLKSTYSCENIKLWITDQSDIEAEFCSPSFLSSLTGKPEANCEIWISELLTTHTQPISDQFDKQRKAHNQELHSAGGSPLNIDVWNERQAEPLKGAKGKFVYNKLKNKVPRDQFTDQAIASHTGFPEIGYSLRQALEQLLPD